MPLQTPVGTHTGLPDEGSTICFWPHTSFWVQARPSSQGVPYGRGLDTQKGEPSISWQKTEAHCEPWPSQGEAEPTHSTTSVTLFKTYKSDGRPLMGLTTPGAKVQLEPSLHGTPGCGCTMQTPLWHSA